MRLDTIRSVQRYNKPLSHCSYISFCLHACGSQHDGYGDTWTILSASQWPQVSNHLPALDGMSTMDANENAQPEQHLDSKASGISLAFDSTSADMKIY